MHPHEPFHVTFVAYHDDAQGFLTRHDLCFAVEHKLRNSQPCWSLEPPKFTANSASASAGRACLQDGMWSTGTMLSKPTRRVIWESLSDMEHCDHNLLYAPIVGGQEHTSELWTRESKATKRVQVP
jgi:hypothetical protein